MSDPRRGIPRTDVLLGRPEFVDAAARLGPGAVKAAVRAAQERARQGLIAPDAVASVALAALAAPTGVRAVLNATGVVVHTNLGRAPLSESAIAAVAAASGYVDLELDLATGDRRDRSARVAGRLAAASGASAAMVVNNGAAALVLAVTALAAGGEAIVSRGELVEIGDGFRIAELICSTGVRLREVGATNRTSASDYADALAGAEGPTVVVKVHPSNYRIEGFGGAATVAAIAGVTRPARTPLVVDIGSGLLRPDDPSASNALVDEPDAASALASGADLVVCSADKLLGGPQAGLILGDAAFIAALRRHPLARALRVDKLTLAALEATLAAEPPVSRFRRLTADDLLPRTQALAEAVGGEVVPCQGRIGGGGAPGVDLPGWAVALPVVSADAVAAALRVGVPAVLARIERRRVLVDLRCVPADADGVLTAAIERALGRT